jgi:hypothetical protein
MDDTVRRRIQEKLNDYIAWSRGRTFSDCRVVQYSGADVVGTMDLPMRKVESCIERTLGEGLRVDWAEHRGRLILKVWEFGSPEPDWPSVFDERPLADADPALRASPAANGDAWGNGFPKPQRSQQGSRNGARNLLLERVEYKIDETSLGVWRRFLHPSGELFEEFVSHRRIGGWPLLHYTRGRCPETGKRITARGIVAIGRVAVGAIAIGQASAGIIAVGQLAIGLVFGLGQATTGLFALGQLAIAGVFGVGQFTMGYVAIGQMALGHYVLAQFGLGQEVWDIRGVSPAAQQFFRSLIP